MRIMHQATAFLGLIIGFSCAAFGADDHTANERTHVMSWGKPANGLQAGIRCRIDQQKVRGDAVSTLDILIRNVSEELISIEYLEAQRYFGELTDTTVTGHPGYEGDGFPSTINIPPGEIREVGDIPVGHVLKKRPGVAYVYRVELPPGKYQVGCDRVLVDGDTNDPPLLGTGYLDIEIVK